MGMLTMYDIFIDESDKKLVVDFNSLVSYPAHSKSMLAFGKDAPRYTFNEDQRMVTGVMIASNHAIYRPAQGGLPARFVRFSPKAVETIQEVFHKNGFQNNLNLQHDPNQKVGDVVMLRSYIVSNSDPKLPNVPEAFAKQNIQDGSWMATYKIYSDDVWARVKSGEFGGFSVEGYFLEKLSNIKKVNSKNHKMKDSKKTLLQKIFGKFEDDPQPADNIEFAEATTVDGVVVFYEGDLAVGTEVQVEVDGQRMPAPEGEHAIEIEGGTIVIMLDANGVVTEIEEVAAEEAVTAEGMAAAFQHFAAQTEKHYAEMFEAQEKRIKALEDALSESKFDKKPLKNGEAAAMKSWKTIGKK
jgi:hypothetical protein